MKNRCLILCFLLITLCAAGQAGNCIFKPPAVTINFGTGDAGEVNTASLRTYDRVSSSCPSDGHYSYASSTSDCFRGDWHTLPEDHTPGDVNGNMLLVNAAYEGGAFFTTAVRGLKSGSIYEFGVWLTNLCRISDKCPFPLLPNIIIRLQTPNGKIVAQFGTGEVVRRQDPHWTQYRAVFTMPAPETMLFITMVDTNPGGCGNDFAMDDITFRECVKQPPVTTTVTKTPVVVKKQTQAQKPVAKKETPAPVKKQTQVAQVPLPKTNAPITTAPVVKQKPVVFAAPPPILTTRANPLVKQIQAEAGEIKIDLYDNGEIDGDTVTIYHNNELVVGHARLSQKPISFHITLDAAHPHHELIMVADNLGSIPPNTSLMIVTAGSKRYQVFISSTEQKNAKVEFDLKE